MNQETPTSHLIALQLLTYLREQERQGGTLTAALSEAEALLLGGHWDQPLTLGFAQPQSGSDGTFAMAWSLWPHPGRRRSSKTKAATIWKKAAHRTPPATLLKAVKRYAASPDALKDGGAFVPALDRWLSQGRYEGWLTDEEPQRIGFV